VGSQIDDFLELVEQLDVDRIDSARYSTFKINGDTFGYLWPRTRTVGLKQLVAEQLALVAERPEVSKCSSLPAGSAGSWSTLTASIGQSSLNSPMRHGG
jgi:hypothetical protein